MLHVYNTIDLFVKLLGNLPILAKDQTFEAKLKSNQIGKHNNFTKSIKNDDQFAVVQYAGTVSYSVSGWLDKTCACQVFNDVDKV